MSRLQAHLYLLALEPLHPAFHPCGSSQSAGLVPCAVHSGFPLKPLPPAFRPRGSSQSAGLVPCAVYSGFPLKPLPPAFRPRGSSQSAGLVPCAVFSGFPLAIYTSMLLSRFVPSPSSPLRLQVRSLRLRLYSCPVNRFVSTIFLDSIYMY